MMDFISMCDGKTSILVKFANKLNVPAWDLYNLTEMLNYKNLIEENTLILMLDPTHFLTSKSPT